ncbi:MAG TPA: glycoside hydrolase family 3 protein [Vicinamibacterales bacterium]|nr:glycoside hydrolase family 3 protein [Vicinamibacterales bacterium]
MKRAGRLPLVAALCVLSAGLAAQTGDPLDRAARRWVESAMRTLTLDQKIGQLITSSSQTLFVSSDSDTFDELTKRVTSLGIGGMHIFGGSEPAPPVLLNPTYGTVTLGQPLAAASLLNRLQALSPIPLLNTADFEAGVGFRLAGATAFPRTMAFGAAGDEKLAYEAGRITAVEGRALGVHVNFAPIVDVNNNPRNPVINTRAFGEDPHAVGRLGAAYVRGLQDGGMIATLKHFPGHGDTDVDSHLGLPVIAHPRDRLDRVELPPFRAGIAAGAGAVMSAHVQMPAIDPAAFAPATLSHAALTGLLRGDLGFGGLIYTDSMGMQAISNRMPPGEAAARAVQAGNDIVLHSPDDGAAVEGIRQAIASGQIPMAQVDASVRRILEAKAKLGLHKQKLVSLDEVPLKVGTRAHRALAQEVSRRGMTLVKDERSQVPLKVARDARVLYLSVLDYPTGWRIAAPSRTFIPELRKRWPNVTAIELSDRTTPSEVELVRAMGPRYDAIVVSVFVRTASYSGRMDLAPPLMRLLNDLARTTAASKQPFVTTFFGNPYVATFLPDLPAMLVTYDFYDLAEASAVRALAGEASITGKLPIDLPGIAPVGTGLSR